MRIRKARPADARTIDQLISGYSADGTLLPRSLPEIRQNIRNFLVAEEAGVLIGCGALHFYGLELVEIRSVAVAPAAQGRGAGRRLVEALLREAKVRAVGRICLFTRIPDYFARFGFLPAARETLPEKLWKDCLRCPRLHCCDETPMILRDLPARVSPLRVLRTPSPSLRPQHAEG